MQVDHIKYNENWLNELITRSHFMYSDADIAIAEINK